MDFFDCTKAIGATSRLKKGKSKKYEMTITCVAYNILGGGEQRYILVQIYFLFEVILWINIQKNKLFLAFHHITVFYFLLIIGFCSELCLWFSFKAMILLLDFNVHVKLPEQCNAANRELEPYTITAVYWGNRVWWWEFLIVPHQCMSATKILNYRCVLHIFFLNYISKYLWRFSRCMLL